MTTFYEKPDSQYTPYAWMDDANCTLYPIGEWDDLGQDQRDTECAACPVQQLCQPFMRRPTMTRRTLRVGGTCPQNHYIATKADLHVRRDGYGQCKACEREKARQRYHQNKRKVRPVAN